MSSEFRIALYQHTVRQELCFSKKARQDLRNDAEKAAQR